ncbi:MAG: DciA family protein [Alphaproteobacteria bacterium]
MADNTIPKPKKKQSDAWIKKHRYGTHDLSDSISRLAALNFVKRGLGNGAIVKEWSHILPEPWSKITILKRIQWQGHEQVNGILEISLRKPAMSTILLHHKSELIEYVNIWFGYRAIRDIRIVQPV